MANMELSSAALVGALEAIGLKGYLQEGPQEMPLDQIYVPLSEDSDGNELHMIIGLLNTPVSGDPNVVTEELPFSLQFIQIFIPLPLKIDEGFYNDTMHFLHIVNSFAELPGFVVTLQENNTMFRYTIPVVNNSVDADQFAVTVGLALSVVDTYLSTIQSIAKGETTLKQLLEETSKS